VSLVVVEDEAPDLLQVGLFGADAIMLEPEVVAHLSEQCGLALGWLRKSHDGHSLV